MKKISLIGKKFGRLFVLEEVPHERGRHTKWKCRCDCGKIAVVDGSKLKNGHTQSCGCFAIDLSKARAKSGDGVVYSSHRKVKSTEYGIWNGMKNRCFNPKTRSFKSYGAKGVLVCDGWRYSFENFLADMGPRPDPTYSIDRIDSYGNYACGHCEQCLREGWPANCRWATIEIQSSNRRNNLYFTHNGKTQHLKAWASESSIKYGTVYNRVVLAGWPLELALTLAPDSNNRIR